MVIVKVASDAKLRHVDLAGSEDLARPANRIVGWIVEIDDIVDIRPDSGVKKLESKAGSFVRGLPFNQV